MTVEVAHPSTEPLAWRSPTEPAHPRWWFFKTSPGRILAIGIILATLGLLSAFATSTTINNRQSQLTTVLNHTEPLAFAAGQLYTTLSVADAAAATAFIAGSEPRAVRQRYEQAITDAAVAVTRAASGLTDEPLIELLGRINARLAVYTGLIETARTNNRMGNPVGSSYLSEASALMQQQILPDAQQLYEQTSARVDAETTASTRIPAPVIVVVAITLVFGAFAHRWLASHTKRRVNVGLVAGGLAIVIMIIWVGSALAISTAGSRAAKGTAAESLKTVTTLAITAQQARADETLSLIRRGDEDLRKRSYYQRVETMHQQLTDYLAREDAIDKTDLAGADQLLMKWRQADERINAYISVGNYQAATQVALGTGEDDSTPAFDKLDAALSSGIRESRNQLRNDILSARRVLSGTTVGGAVLSIGAAMAVALGLWPRMSEYRG
ncbi:protein kinase G-activating protein GlnX [Mycobacterium sp. DL592]|uniref:protein kinase G-activating protein GlnX n=1 Tax=Mycobacterium sp. DL592 TaxID=2675524 RepID=UPI00142013F1|nr:protein kinase G-activating protein GlnX [Mycobacterium sp. DL592]